MIDRLRLRIRVALAFLLVTAVLGVTASPATATECVDLNGEPRPCTTSEEFRACWGNTYDAFSQCVGGTDNPRETWWQEALYSAHVSSCQIWAGVDQASCILAVPLTTVLKY